jgi:hypothetical protein
MMLLIGSLGAAAQTDPYEAYLKTSPDFRRVAQDPAVLWKAWPTFTYMPWTFKWTAGYTDATGQWSVEHGYNGAFIDREPQGNKLEWIDKHGLRFYVDHVAGKGDLHMFGGSPNKEQLALLRDTGLRPRPLNEATATKLKSLIKAHINKVKASPNRAAYALDDEISWGHFVRPTMWRVTDDEQAYPRWLDEVYGKGNAPKREKWVSYNDIQPKLKTWSVAEFDASPLLDQLTFNDAHWNNFLGDLVDYANSIDPATPVGFVGGQSPNAFGGYDYARLMRKVQFIESYNLGSSQAVIRSFNPSNAIPAVVTHFHRDVADTVWQSWYYLARGNRGFIGWVDGWFDGQTPKPFHEQIGPALKEVEKLSSLMTGATWLHDGVAIYYSHPSIQVGWVLDAQAHGKTWDRRNGDQQLGASHNVRKAWENMLRDSNLQYNFINYVDTVRDGVPKAYNTVILPACLALSDAEAKRLRAFVEEGGTLIAVYLPGLWDQHGMGRAGGGVLDDVFGVKHDPQMTLKDVFGGEKLWTEVDQDANFSYKSYEAFLTNKNTCIKDASGFHKAVRAMDVSHVNKFGKGTAVLMNLSPQWYNAYRVAGAEAAQKRATFVNHVAAKPRVTLKGSPGAAFGHEFTYWRAADGRTLCFLTMNPEIKGNELGGGNSAGLRTESVPVTVAFAQAVKNARDERTGKALGDGAEFKVDWKVNEAVLISFDGGGAK